MTWRTASRSSNWTCSPTAPVVIKWWPNQLRLLFSTLAYTLLEAMQRLALHGTELARAYVGTIRLKLLKIGAVVLRNTRRVRLLLSSHYPEQDLFALVVARLAPD